MAMPPTLPTPEGLDRRKYNRGNPKNLIKKPRGMSDKMKRFCDEYLIDMNATRAALRAGYSKKTAHATGVENLKKPIIQNYIMQQRIKVEKRVHLDQDFVLKGLMKNYNLAIEAGQFGPANRALELLGKYQNMFNDKIQHEHSGPDGSPIQTVNKSLIDMHIDEQTLRLLAINTQK